MRVVIYGEQDSTFLLAALNETGRCEVRVAATAQALAPELPAMNGLVVSNSDYPSIAETVRREAVCLRWLQLTSSGYDSLLASPPRPGILTCRAEGVWTETVAEHALALTLALLRRIPELERDRQMRRWNKASTVLRSLSGMNVTVVGYGGIGQIFAALARQLGANVTAVARNARIADDGTPIYASKQLGELLSTADLVLLAAPAEPHRPPLLDRPALARMQPGSFVVNVGRGSLVDEEALYDALAGGRIAGAALDVFATEPLDATSPLWSLSNLILSPHIAGYGDPSAMERLGRLCASNLLAILDNRDPLGVVSLNS